MADLSPLFDELGGIGPLERQRAGSVQTAWGRTARLWELHRLVNKDAATRRWGSAPYPVVAPDRGELIALASTCLGMAFFPKLWRSIEPRRVLWSQTQSFVRRLWERGSLLWFPVPARGAAYRFSLNLYWARSAVFLWRLVAKSAKIFNPVTSGDVSGLYI